MFLHTEMTINFQTFGVTPLQVNIRFSQVFTPASFNEFLNDLHLSYIHSLHI